MQSYLFNTEVINAAHEQSIRAEGISIGEARGRQEGQNDLLMQMIANGEMTAAQAAKYQMV